MYRVGNGVQLTAIIDESTYQDLHAEAKERDTSVSKLVREVLREHCEKREQDKERAA